MDQFLSNSSILTCSHAEMTYIISEILYNYKMKNGISQEDYIKIAQEILNFVSDRVENEDLIPSYRLFILSKVETAFAVAMEAKNFNNITEASEDMIDIPIEEFESAKIDTDFLKQIGWNE